MSFSTKRLYLEEMRDQGYSAESIGDFHTKMIPYILEKYGVPKDGKLVEVGIAQGHCSISAYRAGYRNLAAVDYVDLNFPRFQADYNIKCFNVDITQQPIPFDDSSVDAFIFFHTIEHISDADSHPLGDVPRHGTGRKVLHCHARLAQAGEDLLRGSDSHQAVRQGGPVQAYADRRLAKF